MKGIRFLAATLFVLALVIAVYRITVDRDSGSVEIPARTQSEETAASDPVLTEQAPESPAPETIGPGRLVLQFLRDEKPVPGVEVVIDGAAGSFPGRSDDGGTVTQDLPDGVYRWTLVSDLSLAVKPADVAVELEEGWSRTSAEFEIRFGETAAFTMRLGSCVVRGTVVDQWGALVPSYDLHLKSQHVRLPSSGKQYAEGWPDEVNGEYSGSFELSGIRASGSYVLDGQEHRNEKVLWITARDGDDVFTARRLFTLEQGEVKDLGAIVLRPESVLEVEVAIHDAQGKAIDAFTEAPRFLLEVVAADDRPMVEVVAETLTVSAGVTRIHGLPQGEYCVEASEALEGWPPLKAGLDLVQDTIFREEVAVPGKTTIVFVAAAVVDVRVEVAPAEQAQGRFTVWAKQEGGRLFTARVRIFNGRVIRELRIPPGNYVIAASNNDLRAAPDAPSLWGEINAIVTEPCSITVPVGQGSRISGRTEDHRRGGVIEEGLLKFEDPLGRVFKTKTDKNGSFSVNGLPPGGSVVVFKRSVLCGAKDVVIVKEW